MTSNPLCRVLFPRPAFDRIGATTTFIRPAASDIRPQVNRNYSTLKGLWR